MNIYLFLSCYLSVMLALGYLIIRCLHIGIRYFFYVYFFTGLLGVNFLILSCNPFFYDSKDKCSSRFLIFSIFQNE